MKPSHVHAAVLLAMLAINVAGKSCAFGDHYDAEITSACMTLFDQLGYVIDVDGHLGDQNYIRAPRDAAVAGNPT